ncbi:MAG: YfhO family protein [Chitinophagales bacterium]|nr:YfhO family protein [Bacteroidota bacterium]MCB9043716.1 YfhO family protein [Chitinophagales bacterium]
MNIGNKLRKLLPHLAATAIFLLVTLFYFYPVMMGKVLDQHDVVSAKGWQSEVKHYIETEGYAPYWTNTMFSGMPTTQIWAHNPGNLLTPVYRFSTLSLFHLNNPVGVIFLCMLCMYIFLLVLNISPIPAGIGSIVFGLSTINAILVNAGHINKITALAYIPLFIAGLLLLVRKKYWSGITLTALAFCLEILANHYQMTLYLLLATLMVLGFEKIYSFQDKRFPAFIQSFLLISAAVVIGFLPNLANLWANYDYAKETIRGKSILQTDKTENANGLDKEYAFSWSYGIGESLDLLIPNLYGGGSTETLSEDSETYQALKQRSPQQAKSFIKQAPTYWGDQPFVVGPYYFGAGVLFLAFLGLLISRNKAKWWLLACTVLFIVIAWGKNFAGFNYFLFDYFPMFNKFRAFTSALSVAHWSAIGLAMLGVMAWLKNETPASNMRSLYISAGVLGGLSLLIALFGKNIYSFSGPVDENFGNAPWLLEALHADRASMLQSDAFRSAFIIFGLAAVLWLYSRKVLQLTYLWILLGIIVLGDVILVSQRYQNSSDFITQSELKRKMAPDEADLEIMEDKSPHYRVLDLTTSTFNDSKAAIYHQLIGGYHAAKLRRYQDIIERYLSQNKESVLNMLNAKYIKVPQNNKLVAVPNPNALGNAWFVREVKWVETPDTEFAALENIDPATTAAVASSFKDQLKDINLSNADTTAQISLSKYNPDRMEYTYNSTTPQLAVFSEIWYQPNVSWKVFVDGNEVSQIRANYLLRALPMPAGKHDIVFTFMPQAVKTFKPVSLAGSVLFILLLLAALWHFLKSDDEEIVVAER